MGVYIPKLTLPSIDSGGYHIEIDASGFAKVYAFNRVGEFWREELVTNAVEVKDPHGRLVDADAIDTSYSDPEVVETLREAPTIIEAEGKDDD